MDSYEFQRSYEYFRGRADHWEALFLTLCLAARIQPTYRRGTFA